MKNVYFLISDMIMQHSIGLFHNHFKICHFFNINYFVTCNVPLDRENIRLFFGVTFNDILHVVAEISP